MIDKYLTPEDYEIAKKNGIDPHVLYHRFTVGKWSKHRATTQPAQIKTNRKKWAEVAEKNGIKYSTFTTRIHRGWSVEKAATTPVIGEGVTVWNGHVIKPDLIERAEKNGIHRELLRQRISKMKWDPEYAAIIKPMTKSEAARRNKKRGLGMF